MADLTLYYTGFLVPLQDQPKTSLSIGGYISKRAVPNSRNGNLFGDISELSAARKKRSIIGLIAQNTSGKTIQRMDLWFVYGADKAAKISVAAVPVSYDASGNPYMEKLNDLDSMPFNAEFHEAIETSHLQVDATIAPNKHFGLWLVREVIGEPIPDTVEAWADRLTSETVKFNVDMSFTT